MPSLISPITEGAIESALSSLFQATGGGSGTAGEIVRSPLLFTSTLRKRVLDGRLDRLKELEQEREATRLGVTIPVEFQGGVTTTADTQLVKEIVDITGAMQKAMPVIKMAVNPSTVSFAQPKRFGTMQTKRGTDYFFFTDSKGENNDVLTISFKGSSGNIFRKPGQSAEDRAKADERLKVWHNLYSLTREPEILSDGTQNQKTITYTSPVFPIEIEFRGFFSKVLEFSEEGTKPGSVDYSMEFTVQETSPGMSNLVAHVNDVLSAATVATPSDEALNL